MQSGVPPARSATRFRSNVLTHVTASGPGPGAVTNPHITWTGFMGQGSIAVPIAFEMPLRVGLPLWLEFWRPEELFERCHCARRRWT
jgi:hypothetical protein